MDYLDKYKKRVSQGGQNTAESMSNNTMSFIESTFTESPTYEDASAISYRSPNIKKVDIRVIDIERLGSIKEILFRPSHRGLGVGSYLLFDEDTWIIFERYGNKKSLVQRCNDTIKWKDYDTGQIIELPCVASASDLGSKAKQGRNELAWNKYDVTLPAGQLFCFVELTDKTEKIRINQRFIFGTKVYEVVGYDDVTAVETDGENRYGLLQLTIKITTSQSQDDFESRIAYNEGYKVDDGDDDDDNNGGIIW